MSAFIPGRPHLISCLTALGALGAAIGAAVAYYWPVMIG